jgi:HEPN domain-containing protein
MAVFQMDKNPRKLICSENFTNYAEVAYKSAKEYMRASMILLPHVTECSILMMSNTAFTCELFLKMILTYTRAVTDEKQLREHNLYKLFNKIEDKSIQERIRKDTLDKQFELTLKEIGKAFEVSRYVHEYQEISCDVKFLYMLMNSLHNECVELVKEKIDE